MLKFFFTTLLLAVMILHPTESVRAVTHSHEFVRTANYFLLSGPALDRTITTLASFDLIVIPVEAQVYNPSFFSEIRKINDDIIILPYVPTVSWNDLYWVDSLHQSMYPQIENDWWLTEGNGNQVSVWPNTRALNLNSEWSEFLPEWTLNEVLSTGYWDGVFYDEVQDSISWVGNVDVNKDGVNDSISEADDLWENKYEDLFAYTRELIGEDYILITNGSSNSRFSHHTNGRMFETFPASGNTLTEWVEKTNEYLNLEKQVEEPSIQVINVNTENSGKQNHQDVRFGLTTTLLGNGYFSYDHGTDDHTQLWTFDEYGAYLGAPKTNIQNTLNPQQTVISTGIWQRDFEEGKVIVNATSTTQTIDLNGEFEKIHGIQDPEFNDGSIIHEVTLQSKDGIVLLRPIQKLFNTPFLNGSFARIFDYEGNTKRTGFFAYENTAKGGTQVIRYDLNLNGEYEYVVADETYVYIYNKDGDLTVQFAPYETHYNQGINISVGDIEDDGSVEIVTGTKNGGGPHIRVFNSEGVLINPGFFAYAENFRGGVSVAIGDLNGDGIKEIISGAGYGGGPHIRVFKKDGTLINPGFFAYDERFRGGVNVSSGDVNGDGIDDIVTGPGYGGESLARVYDRDGNLKSEFMVFETGENSGLNVAVTDVDGNGVAEIIGLTSDVFTLSSLF
jgi:hypothetical protein